MIQFVFEDFCTTWIYQTRKSYSNVNIKADEILQSYGNMSAKSESLVKTETLEKTEKNYGFSLTIALRRRKNVLPQMKLKEVKVLRELLVIRSTARELHDALKSNP